MASLLQFCVQSSIVQVGPWTIRGGPRGAWLLCPKAVESTGTIPWITGLARGLQGLPIGLDSSGHNETVCPMDVLKSLDDVQGDLYDFRPDVRHGVGNGVPDRIIKGELSLY